ncbi:hypothetical protein M514_12275 [Trichuris suis]|uniref:Uncharacterized protein n=1 Tax=Trichuris suis TaxID=68888 RepID=A0A085N6A3_9BILA|nr:hypothetical protein M513_12275 [Trichuris suis]KFD64999.1 hypothetical protein M514_12275 [Trichuris suis]KHJ43450.1 hypothetical protein D918_06359 [Trichuris suis]
MSRTTESSSDTSEQNVDESFGCYHSESTKLPDFLAIVEASCANDLSAEQWESLINSLSKMDIECSLPMEHKNKLINFLLQLYTSDKASAQLAERLLDSLLRSPIFYDGLPDGIDHLLLESRSLRLMSRFLTNFGDVSESSLVQFLKFVLKQKGTPPKNINHSRSIILREIVKYPYTGNWMCSQLKKLNDQESVAFFKWLSDQLVCSMISHELSETASKVTDLLKIIGLLIDAKFSSLSREDEITAEISECAVIVDILLSLLELVRLYEIQQDPKNGDFGEKSSYYMQTGWSR